MSDREGVLGELGIALSGEQHANHSGNNSLYGQDIPSLSGYSEFTPIRILSSDVKVLDADLERDK